MQLNIKDTFSKELPSDNVLDNSVRQVLQATHSYVNPVKPSNPKLIHTVLDMAKAIGVSEQEVSERLFLDVFSGREIYPNTKPYAMAYAGHQFGDWAGQLGDGRAINLFEVVSNDKRWVIQLKGAGKTPYSRRGDGLAVLRSSIREYLCSEAMFNLGVPTTRTLSLMLSGDDVLRDMLYNGNSEYEKGAIVARLAPSFIRFGNFELFASRKDVKNLKRLTDYTIKHFYSELGKPSKETYVRLFEKITNKTIDMIVNWQRVGFVHGVMNTDNMSILGLTIDYGPYGWLDDFDFNWTPNTTDAQNKRYRYGNQPNIALWNLLQLANALYPLVEESEPFELILNSFGDKFEVAFLQMMRGKLGFELKDEKDADLIKQLEVCLSSSETDMTIFYRLLSKVKKGAEEANLEIVMTAFYKPEEVDGELKEKWKGWFKSYDLRLQREMLTDEERASKMNLINPKYVLRNYMAQLAIEAANKGDYNVIDELYNLLKKPYEEQLANEKWFVKRPEWARHKVGCSMLSCSS